MVALAGVLAQAIGLAWSSGSAMAAEINTDQVAVIMDERYVETFDGVSVCGQGEDDTFQCARLIRKDSSVYSLPGRWWRPGEVYITAVYGNGAMMETRVGRIPSGGTVNWTLLEWWRLPIWFVSDFQGEGPTWFPDVSTQSRVKFLSTRALGAVVPTPAGRSSFMRAV